LNRPSLFAGVDGGGSKTLALIAAADGRVLGRGLACGSNYLSVGIESACAALDDALARALAQAGDEPAALRAICLGMAGADRPEARKIFGDWVEHKLPKAKYQLVTDAELVLAAGTPSGWGLALLSGTGSIAWARTPSGQSGRLGGWGPLLGDEAAAMPLA